MTAVSDMNTPRQTLNIGFRPDGLVTRLRRRYFRTPANALISLLGMAARAARPSRR